MRIIALCLACLMLVLPASAQAEDELVHVKMETSEGDIYLALNRTKAPVTVENFLAYAESGYYIRLIFHRVVPGRLIQGGGYNRSLYQRGKRDPITNEADNGLKNLRGTIAMARNDDPDSAQSQFFINTKDNPELDHQGKEYAFDWGYAVFGEVVYGMDVVDTISFVPTEGRGDFAGEVPVEPVYINMVREIDESDIPTE
ncbi:peptidylprolyl isomerase [Parvularcula sp. IMCC14364]|uniref:peptidylprolyl isomerase n=1 Tax=Parvularcula sp. IMCC14364 TaxID=3067902 RepID=UPI0027421C7E|nr:peptidylprolyl isomerase [Parvularcula sp. IMCC14364]